MNRRRGRWRRAPIDGGVDRPPLDELLLRLADRRVEALGEQAAPAVAQRLCARGECLALETMRMSSGVSFGRARPGKSSLNGFASDGNAGSHWR
jgi:hypothetical protein